MVTLSVCSLRHALPVVTASALMGACGGPVLVRDSDVAAVAAGFGRGGAAGVLRFSEVLRVRGDRAVDAEIYVPTADDDTVDLGGQPVLLVQGGSVSVERYEWLAVHLASRGAVVVAPHFLFDLAFFDQGDASDALAAARARSEIAGDPLDSVIALDAPAMAIGHSLGGVVAATAFETDRGIGSLALLASYPDPSSTPTRRDGLALTVVGADDGLVNTDDVIDGADALRVPVTAAVAAGLTHFQLTDDATAAEIAKEGTSSDVDIDDARFGPLFLIDALLAATAADDDGAVALTTPGLWPAPLQPLSTSTTVTP